MIICIDVGNTNIKYALFEGNELKLSFRVATEHKKTSDEYGGQIISILKNSGIRPEDIDGGIISSVVPPLDYTIERMCRTYLKIKPMLLAPGLKTGLNIKVDNAREVGADRVVNNVAAIKKYGAPAIVIDFGTATTFNVISEKGEFLGGLIGHGLKSAAEALSTAAARLPKVELILPNKIVGKNTINNMQAGLIHGYIGMAERIVRLIKQETGYATAKVIATGGLSELIYRNSDIIDVMDRTLTLRGLNIIYNMNK